MPMGPAMLATESGVPTFAVTVRRLPRGRYRGRVIRIDVPTEGSRRQRVTATMNLFAAAFEDLIADAPDQWWAVFFPLWPDLEGATTSSSRTRDAEEPEPATPDAGDPTGAAA